MQKYIVYFLLLIIPLYLSAAPKKKSNLYLIHSDGDVLIAHAIVTKPPYNADPTGKKDASRAINNALEDIGEMGGGLVYIPAGKYKIKSTITIKQDKVVLQGEPSRPGKSRSTVLLAYTGKGNEEARAFITVTGLSCGLKNLAVYYPEQGKGGFIPYPYTIKSKPSVLLENLVLYNSYNGIHFTGLNGVLIENIRMCALKNGLTGYYSSEFAWARNIEVSADVWESLPAYISDTKPGKNKILAYMKKNSVGVELGALDGFLLSDLYAKDCKTALLVRKNIEFLGQKDEKRLKDNFGFGGIINNINGRIEYNGLDFYYWAIPAVNLDNVKGLPELRKKWPKHRVPAKSSGKDFFHIKKFGAKGNGITDDTGPLLKALKAAKNNKGGIIYFPQGKFRITKEITVPPGTELRGANARQEVRLAGTEVTSLLCETGSGSRKPDTDPAFITLSDNSGIRGLNILYPEQWTKLDMNSFDPVPYPYAVRGHGENIYLLDTVITPAWNMIDFASHPCNNFMIKRVAGWGIKKGINIGAGTRGGTIEFTQLTFGLMRASKYSMLGEYSERSTKSRYWDGLFDILSGYSGKNSEMYLFGNCSDLKLYGLQGFHPLRHIVMYKQNNAGMKNSQFYFPILDVSTEHSLVMDGAQNIDFYGYWVTGRNEECHWAKGKNIKNIRVFAPGIQPSYHLGNYEKAVPLDQFKLIPETSQITGAKIIKGDPKARNVLDHSLDTFWKTTLKKAKFVADLGKVMKIKRISLTDGHLYNFKETSAIKNFKISVSLDNSKWEQLEVIKGNWLGYQYTNPMKYVIIDRPTVPKNARYIKLEILNVWNPINQTAIIRMFNVWADPIR